VLPERCERFRNSVSLGVDGMLSPFEEALLDRHLKRCADCNAFAAGLTAQTQLLRAAPLEEPLRAIAIAPSARGQIRRRATGLGSALAVAATAAMITLTHGAGHRSATATLAASGTPLLAVYAAQPGGPDMSLTVPRLRVVSPASADGPVHGDYGLPVRTIDT
jgi:predicted anti-sigma-YlaC factor YlaD